ncbi:uncharacterized protein JCM15063_002614 [Sporobolomyces koalae]|uniref:uncharacterized protein n=1 Tax=Sporobolomyces koalae TaxID=500713 RepID=UPI003175286C
MLSSAGSGLLATAVLFLSQVASGQVQDSDPTHAGQIEFPDADSLPSRTLERLQLYHRFQTSQAPSNWIKRGDLVVEGTDSSELRFEPSESSWDDLALPETLETVRQGHEWDAPRYELSVRTSALVDDAAATFVSIDLCELFSTEPTKTLEETLVLHVARDDPEMRSIGVQYSTRRSDNACRLKSDDVRARARFALKDRLHARIERAQIIPTPQLPQPVESKTRVQVDKDGKVIPPAPPKSFLQKYWMYILPAVVFVLIGGGGADEAGAAKK